MKKICFVAICLMALVISCKQKGQTTPADSSDSLTAVIDSIIEENDSTPMPMYLMYNDEGRYMLMLYWTNIEEPKKAEDDNEYFDDWHQSWALQEMFRRNAAEYTNLLTDNGIAKVKFVDEVLKDPDGNTPSTGEIHGRDDIPSLCARFEYVNKKDMTGDMGGVVVTDSYLKTRKRLDIKYDQSEWNKPTPLPDAAVKKLEKRYGMKVESMRLMATFGEDYVWGKLQFKGECKNAPKNKYDPDMRQSLALDVLIKGDEVYANEDYGYYDESGSTWNADDDGEYVGCNILAAFEGPKGLELFYRRNAPESVALGMFYQRGDQLIQHCYEIYHVMIDEEIPVWKKDFAEMKKLFLADDPHENKDVDLTKWAHCYIDYDNEWIWLRDAKDEYGAIFIRDDNGKFKLIATETPKLKFSRMSKGDTYYLLLSGSAGGPSTYSEVFAFKNGKQIEHFNALFVYGEIDGCELNGRELSKEAGQAYYDNLPESKAFDVYFHDIEPNSK